MVISTKDQGDVNLLTMLEAASTLEKRLDIICQHVLPRIERKEARRIARMCAEIAIMCERGAKTLSNREAYLIDAAERYIKDPSEENRRAAAVKTSDIPDPHRRGDKRRQPWAPWAAEWAFDVAEGAPFRAATCALSAANVAEKDGVDVTEANALLMKAVADL